MFAHNLHSNDEKEKMDAKNQSRYLQQNANISMIILDIHNLCILTQLKFAKARKRVRYDE